MYRTIQACFWTDPDIRPLSPDQKLLKLYLITNTHTHVSGIYYLPTSTISEETGLKIPHVDTLLDTLSHVKIDRTRMVVWVEKMLHYQARGEKAYRAAAHQLTRLHNSPLIKDFLIGYPQVKRYLIRSFLDEVSRLGPLKEEEEEDKTSLPLNSSSPLNPLLTSYTEDQVLTLWNSVGLKECQKMTADLRKKIRAKLKEHPEEQWWIDLFARVRQSNWLSGRVAGRNGKESFMATLRWVIGKQNLAKIEEGNYDNRTNESSLFRGMNEFLQKEDA